MWKNLFKLTALFAGAAALFAQPVVRYAAPAQEAGAIQKLLTKDRDAAALAKAETDLTNATNAKDARAIGIAQGILAAAKITAEKSAKNAGAGPPNFDNDPMKLKQRIVLGVMDLSSVIKDTASCPSEKISLYLDGRILPKLYATCPEPADGLIYFDLVFAYSS